MLTPAKPNPDTIITHVVDATARSGARYADTMNAMIWRAAVDLQHFRVLVARIRSDRPARELPRP